MTSTTTVTTPWFEGPISRTFALAYETAVYTILLSVFVYTIGFTGRCNAPKHVGSSLSGPPLYMLTINLVLFGLFALRRNGFARRGFRRVLSRTMALTKRARSTGP